MAIIPGQIITSKGYITVNEASTPGIKRITVVNTADYPISVGSHCHFAETNPYLRFDRQQGLGRRLNVCAGGMVRWEPGATIEVELITLRPSRGVMERSRRNGHDRRAD